MKHSRKLTGMSTTKRNRILPYLMIAPAVIFLLIFTVYPIVYLVYLSFQKYDLINPAQSAGFANYYRLFFVDMGFWNALWNTVTYTVMLVAAIVFLALVLAVWLQKSTVLNAIAQRLMFLPHLCSGIAVALIFSWLMDDEGLLNAVLNFFKLPALRWLKSSNTAMLSVVIVSVWKNMGYYALILMGSLKSIPTELNEAADLDNAGVFRRFFRITLPMLSPQLFFLVISTFIGSFKVFELVRTLTGGGPGDSTDVLVFYIYRTAFSGRLNIGLASAAGVVLMVILAVLTVLYFRAAEKKVHYQ